MGNGLHEQIKEIIMDHVYVERMTYRDGETVFTYVGVAEAATLIMSKFYDRLESIGCE